MKKIALVLTLLVFAFSAFAADQIIDLKAKWGAKANNPVMFNHTKHQAGNTCTDCHKTAKGGDLVFAKTKDGAHKFCKDCHTKKSAPVKGCNDCHKK